LCDQNYKAHNSERNLPGTSTEYLILYKHYNIFAPIVIIDFITKAIC
jgi:hypothetical protein